MMIFNSVVHHSYTRSCITVCESKEFLVGTIKWMNGYITMAFPGPMTKLFSGCSWGIAYVTRYLIFQFFKKYVDAFANNILNGSETFLVDINLNNNCIKNVHTPTSNDDAVIKVFWETTYRKKSDDNQLLRFGSGNRWDSDGKTIYDQSRVQYDDEAVTLKQTKDITNKKIDIDDQCYPRH